MIIKKCDDEQFIVFLVSSSYKNLLDGLKAVLMDLDSEDFQTHTGYLQKEGKSLFKKILNHTKQSNFKIILNRNELNLLIQMLNEASNYLDYWKKNNDLQTNDKVASLLNTALLN